MVLRYDADAQEAIICVGWGTDTDWVRNLRAGPAAQVRLWRESLPRSTSSSPMTRLSTPPSGSAASIPGDYACSALSSAGEASVATPLRTRSSGKAEILTVTHGPSRSSRTLGRSSTPTRATWCSYVSANPSMQVNHVNRTQTSFDVDLFPSRSYLCSNNGISRTRELGRRPVPTGSGRRGGGWQLPEGCLTDMSCTDTGPECPVQAMCQG
jgi:hypothetical protein